MPSKSRRRTAAVLGAYAATAGLVALVAGAYGAWEKELLGLAQWLSFDASQPEADVRRVVISFVANELVHEGVGVLATAWALAAACGVIVMLWRNAAASRLLTTGHDRVAAAARWLNAGRNRLTGLALTIATLPMVALTCRNAWQGLERWTNDGASVPGQWDWGIQQPHYEHLLPTCSAPGLVVATWIVPAMLFFVLARAGLRAAVAPLEPRAADSKRADGLHFRAIAVRSETRATVAVMSLLSILAVAAATTLPLDSVVHDPRLLPAFLAYALAAIATALSFRASRVAVGLDGIFVQGTLRKSLLSYRELDSVNENERGEVILRPAKGAPIRLQLHGSDSGRRGAILERIRARIARAREIASGGVARLAEAASPALLEQAARGDGNYRARGASRDELWQVLEAPSTPLEARAAAARALVKTSDTNDRERLRFTAEHFADARSRAALLRIVTASPEDDAREEPAAPAKRFVAKREAG